MTLVMAMVFVLNTAAFQVKEVVPLKCSDFKRNSDGSWTSITAFNPLGAGDEHDGLVTKNIRFFLGDQMDGLDIARILNDRCHVPVS